MLKHLFLLCLLCAPTVGSAGAWPREKGEVFLSLSQEIYDAGRANEQYTKLYAEYGFSPRFTLGAETSNSAAYGKQSIAAFVRARVGKPDARQKLAIELGLGVEKAPSGPSNFLRGGTSWGVGFESPLGHGWGNIDVSTEYWLLTGSLVQKADFTLGLQAKKRTKLILQLQTGGGPMVQDYARFAPSVVYELRPGRLVEFGVRKGLYGDRSQGVKIGTWLQF